MENEEVKPLPSDGHRFDDVERETKQMIHDAFRIPMWMMTNTKRETIGEARNRRACGGGE